MAVEMCGNVWKSCVKEGDRDGESRGGHLQNCYRELCQVK